MSPAYISAALRQRVAETARFRCGYCLTSQRIIGPLLEIDHIISSPFAISFRSYVNFQPIEYTLVMLIDISCGCSECFVQNMPTFIAFINLVYLGPNL